MSFIIQSKEFKHHLLFIVAYDNNNNIIAGTINLVSKTHFYGRYWGAFKFVPNLHFEVCYYKAIEYCIENKITYMEPGRSNIYSSLFLKKVLEVENLNSYEDLIHLS